MGGLLLDLQADTIDDEAFLLICRQTGRLNDLVDRLLSLNRTDEAVGEAESGQRLRFAQPGRFRSSSTVTIPWLKT